MDEVKRYDIAGQPEGDGSVFQFQRKEGKYVLNTDYAKLEAERDAWKRLAKARASHSRATKGDSAFEAYGRVRQAEQALRDLGVME